MAILITCHCIAYVIELSYAIVVSYHS